MPLYKVLIRHWILRKVENTFEKTVILIMKFISSILCVCILVYRLYTVFVPYTGLVIAYN